MAADKFDWAAIKADFIAGRKPGELSRKYGPSAKTISNRASAEGWGKNREEIGKEIGTSLTREIADRVADQIADEATAFLQKQLRDLQQLWDATIAQTKKLIDDETTREVATKAGPMDIKLGALDRLVGLRRSAASLKDIQRGIRTAMGFEDKDPNPGGGEDDEETGVIILPELDPLPDQKGNPHETS